MLPSSAIEGCNGYHGNQELGRGRQSQARSQSQSQSGLSVASVEGLDPLSMSVCAPHIGSSATSGFLSQKLTQPLTALLKQRSELKNSNISQFFIDFKGKYLCLILYTNA